MTTTADRTEPLTMSIPEAGRLLGIGTTLAYDLAARGEFPVRVLKLGRRKLVSRPELDAYLEGRAQSA